MHAVWHALLRTRAHRMLIGGCNPMFSPPIAGVRSATYYVAVRYEPPFIIPLFGFAPPSCNTESGSQVFEQRLIPQTSASRLY